MLELLTPSRRAIALALPIFLALAPEVGAQQDSAAVPLVTDRPDFTESAVTVKPGRFQIESGATFTDAGAEESTAIGEVLVRIGLARRLELRVGLNSYLTVDSPGGDRSGIEDPSLGLKLRLADGGGGRPESAVLLSTTLPEGSREVGADDAQPKALLALAWSLGDAVGLASNLGVARPSDGGNRFTEWSGSLALSRSFTDRVGGFVEYFGFTRSGGGGPATHFLDAGVTRLLGPDLQIDFRLGAGLNSAAADYFAGAGLAWRSR